MSLFLVSISILGKSDAKAAVDLLREAGATFKGPTPPIGVGPSGLIYEAPAELGEALGLVEWV